MISREERQWWREYAQRLQRAPAGEETIATGIGIDKLLDDIAQAKQQADSLSNALDEEREHNESLQVALNEKTAEIRILEEKVAALERVLHSSLRP